MHESLWTPAPNLTTMAVSTAVVKPAPPGAFTFLKQGVLLPARRCGLFAQVVALDAVLSLPLFLIKHLPVGPIITTSAAATYFIALGTGAAYIVLSMAAAAVTRVAGASAAVASHSGPRPSCAGWRATSRVAPPPWPPAEPCGPRSAPPLLFWEDASPLLLVLGALAVLLASLFLVYLGVVCAVAVVVSAAEPGRRGSAVARAWRLMRGTGTRALVYVAATWAVWAAAGPVGALAVGWLLPQAAGRSVLVGAGVRHVLDHAVEVFSVATASGYYFDCRRSEEDDKAGHVD